MWSTLVQPQTFISTWTGSSEEDAMRTEELLSNRMVETLLFSDREALDMKNVAINIASLLRSAEELNTSATCPWNIPTANAHGKLDECTGV